MENAGKESCKIIYNPTDRIYDEEIREFQGCPTIAVTKGGRIFAGWYSGGDREPHIENYNLLVYSDDLGKTWSKPVLVIPSDKKKLIHCLDIQLWTAPDGRLFMFWIQNNVLPYNGEEVKKVDGQPLVVSDGYIFNDFRHSQWISICENPDAGKIEFSAPRCIGTGFLRCKPLALQSGRWLLFNYDQISDRYGYSISDDGGKTYKRCYGGKKVSTNFDEGMAYQRKDKSIRLFARTKLGEIAQSVSCDDGETWSDGALTGIDSPDTRFYVSVLPSGRVLLINNDSRTERENMSVYLSEDEGRTFKYKRCIDTRKSLSYPDVDFYDGRIYLVYDRERMGEAEILFTSFTESDIMNDDYKFEIKTISKPKKQG